jgi:predicted transcriptional regulator of viral defense system
LATRLVETGHYIFTTEQARRAAAEIGMPQSSVAVTLGRLAEAAWILRLRRGLYAGTGRLPGGFDLHPFAVATSLVHPSAVSHWSALSYHGLTSQVPRTVTATTPKKVMTPSMRGPAGERDHRKGKHLWRAAGLEIEYVKIRLDRFFGTEDVWVDEHFRVSVTDVERSVLDMFASPRTFGGLDAGLATLEEHAERLDLQRLAEYSLRFASKAVSARLGWCLEKVGAGALVLEQLRSHVGPGIQVLDPTRAARGHRDARWCVLDNVSPSD